MPCAHIESCRPSSRNGPRVPEIADNVSRSKSSARWLKEHFSDPYVKRAQAEGWRSRAVGSMAQAIDTFLAKRMATAGASN